MLRNEMILGVYCFLGGAFMVGGLLVFPVTQKNRVRFLLLASLCVVAGLILFEALSAALGITRFGEPVQSSYPQDYLTRGPLGWLAMVLPVLAVISPLLLAVWLSRSERSHASRP